MDEKRRNMSHSILSDPINHTFILNRAEHFQIHHILFEKTSVE
jgi:hypothetical protein